MLGEYMGMLRRFVELPQFSECLKVISDFSVDESRMISEAIIDDLKDRPDEFSLPANISWKRLLSAYRVVSAALVNEGEESVVEDLAAFAATYSEESRDRLLANLRPDEEFTTNLLGVQQRDSLLPILQGMNVALDLRVIDLPENTGLTPVVTARMQFDEVIGGGESAVFQVPLEEIQSIIEDLKAIQKNLSNIKNIAEGSKLLLWGNYFEDAGDEAR